MYKHWEDFGKGYAESSFLGAYFILFYEEPTTQKSI